MPKLKINPISITYHLIKRDVHKLDFDASTQWKFHRKMTHFWFVNFFVVIGIYIFFPGIWSKASVLYLVIVSIYANLATDYGAIPSSYAAMKADDIQARQTQSPTQNDITSTEADF